MAEFGEVMRQWRRMCDAMDICDKCKLTNYPLDSKVCGSVPVYLDEKYIATIEARIMDWAAEHQEPVYPTWVEWLKSMGVVPYMTGLVVTRGADNGHFHDGRVNITAKALEAIPADIAEKLGVQPKEG